MRHQTRWLGFHYGEQATTLLNESNIAIYEPDLLLLMAD